MCLYKNNITISLILIFLLMSAAAFAQDDDARLIKQHIGDPAAGMEKSQLCQGCHGEFGHSTVGLIPKLAGQYAKYIVKQIHDYQAGTRTHQIMNAMAGTINDEDDLADIAAYFASQTKMKGSGSGDNKLGKNLFLHGDTAKMRLACVNCHGAQGKGLDTKITMFPVIGGQHKDYLRKQLIDFRSGFRTNSPRGIMNTVAQSLTDAEIEALAEYVSQF